jgi:hypothetical protein
LPKNSRYVWSGFLKADHIKKLGHGSNKDYEKVANIIEGNFDILTVIEVMQKGGDHPGYDDLMQALGAEWAGTITDSPRPNTNAGDADFTPSCTAVAQSSHATARAT